MKLKLSKAKKTEPFWWMKCEKGMTTRQYVSVYKCTHKEKYDSTIYGVIIGRWNLRFIF